jgi:hypothetical protein
MNALDRYFAESGENITRLAIRMGRAPSTVLRAVKGERGKLLELARAVEKATDGKVTAAEFLAICVGATPPCADGRSAA